MKHIITENDKSTLLQKEVNYKYRVLVTNESGHILDTISMMNINNYSIDGTSMMRRTFSMTYHSDNTNQPIRRYLETWFPLNFALQIGIESFRTNDYIWYDCGTYVISDISTVYDATTNMIELKFIDWFGKLDGTRNGQIGGAPTILIPNEDENGNKITIKQSFTNFLQSEGLKNLIIEDLGEFYGVQSNNPQFMVY